ncbi:hypothetical protein SAMN05421810_107193 [Amycolatopsis arida]|uniref:Uncharacterized protein n=1 Tax=Amycolatopsis arida TaxID=587909 RepID=A0A1I5YJS3_9PSEU|nr:hypothetical protein [Amycolatopsis arida]TDX90546.1 hypothetical protein CLV69_107193 [Amycolatopsis arida]SFQ44127.1 hypothetical protein SAMN05421810_107193 [Amycolatopsis arida]
MALGRVRRLVATRLANMVDFRINERVRPLEERVTEQEHCTVDHRKRLDAVEGGLEHVRGDIRWIQNELDRLMPHVAALEDRLETLRERLAVVPPADEPEVAEARSLIEEIQRQHAQIRVRLTGIARYEDRLRKLEERLASSNGAG